MRDWVLSQFSPDYDDVADRICLRMRYEVPANMYAHDFLASMNEWDLLDVIDTMSLIALTLVLRRTTWRTHGKQRMGCTQIRCGRTARPSRRLRLPHTL